MILFYFHLRKKKTPSPSQEKPEKKKARKKSSDSITSDLSTLFSPACDADKAECKDIKTALEGNSDHLIDGKDVTSMIKMDLPAMEKIKLQHVVKS